MIVLVKSDDWEGLYINNRLWQEEHMIEISTIIKACSKFGLNITDLEEVWVTDDYYDNVLSVKGNYPDSYDEVETE